MMNCKVLGCDLASLHYMFLDMDQKLPKLVEELTTSGEPQLNPEKMKELKKICKSSEEQLCHAYHLLMSQLNQEHAEIRLSAFQVVDALFARSHQFRVLVVSNFQEFLELTLGTDHEQPLPPPREVAQKLRRAAIQAVERWNEKYGEAYKKLALGYHFLLHNKQVDFQDVNARTLAERKREEEKQKRLDNIYRERAKQAEREMEGRPPDLGVRFSLHLYRGDSPISREAAPTLQDPGRHFPHGRAPRAAQSSASHHLLHPGLGLPQVGKRAGEGTVSSEKQPAREGPLQAIHALLHPLVAMLVYDCFLCQASRAQFCTWEPPADPDTLLLGVALSKGHFWVAPAPWRNPGPGVIEQEQLSSGASEGAAGEQASEIHEEGLQGDAPWELICPRLPALPPGDQPGGSSADPRVLVPDTLRVQEDEDNSAVVHSTRDALKLIQNKFLPSVCSWVQLFTPVEIIRIKTCWAGWCKEAEGSPWQVGPSRPRPTSPFWGPEETLDPGKRTQRSSHSLEHQPQAQLSPWSYMAGFAFTLWPWTPGAGGRPSSLPTVFTPAAWLHLAWNLWAMLLGGQDPTMPRLTGRAYTATRAHAGQAVPDRCPDGGRLTLCRAVQFGQQTCPQGLLGVAGPHLSYLSEEALGVIVAGFRSFRARGPAARSSREMKRLAARQAAGGGGAAPRDCVCYGAASAMGPRLLRPMCEGPRQIGRDELESNDGGSVAGAKPEARRLLFRGPLGTWRLSPGGRCEKDRGRMHAEQNVSHVRHLQEEQELNHRPSGSLGPQQCPAALGAQLSLLACWSTSLRLLFTATLLPSRTPLKPSPVQGNWLPPPLRPCFTADPRGKLCFATPRSDRRSWFEFTSMGAVQTWPLSLGLPCLASRSAKPNRTCGLASSHHLPAGRTSLLSPRAPVVARPGLGPRSTVAGEPTPGTSCGRRHLPMETAALGDGSEDEDEFVEVPEKEGYEPHIPDHLRAEYGLDPAAPVQTLEKDPLGGSSAHGLHARTRMRRDEEASDPTSAAAQLRLLQAQLPPPSPTSSSRVLLGPDEAQKLAAERARAPVVPFGVDLCYWGQEQSAAGKILKADSQHRFWKPSEVDEEVDNADVSEMLRSRHITFAGKFEPVQHQCRAPRPDGRLCERQDRLKCPFHGKIIPRDDRGQPLNAEDRAREQRQQLQRQAERPDWQDPELLRDVEAAVKADLGSSRYSGKGKGKGKRMKYPNLTDLKRQADTARARIGKKVFDKAAVRRVVSAMNQMDRKKHEKFANQFNYALN
nr:UV-stimulated scaffold protein A [Loxodonta africana]